MRNRHRTSLAHSRQSGFTLVELLVAIMILVVGVLGLASTAAVVMRQMTGAWLQTRAAILVQSRLEELRSTDCGAIRSGTASDEGFTESWRVTIQNRTARIVDVVSWRDRDVMRSVTFTSQRACR